MDKVGGATVAEDGDRTIELLAKLSTKIPYTDFGEIAEGV